MDRESDSKTFLDLVIVIESVMDKLSERDVVALFDVAAVSVMDKLSERETVVE